ncbi:GntR family transcriptional regulator [Cellulomonas sp. PhB143]|uniref:GntR family transcriptional regulator n=1 Tax=Cellulomonas sp. PhB143 TaxID=2485186 RepID=UPI0018F3C5E1|nr:GntR family transcriptional regulator [Cellulomonas sp. PhB143]
MPAVPAAERAYAHLKSRILSGDLPGGTLVSEVQVGEALGLSRTPVHEAFLRLGAERLLTLSPRRGAVVVPVPAGESRDVLEAREALEAGAARRLVEDGTTGAVLPRLTEAVALMRAQLASGDVDGFAAADDAFHAAVVDGSGNALVADFYARLRDHQHRLRQALLREWTRDLQGSLDDHVELRAAIEAGDGERYQRVLRRHVARYRGAL